MKTGCAAFLLWMIFVRASFAEVSVEIEVIMGRDSSLLAPQEWSRLLGEAGFQRPMIRNGRPGDELGIKNRGSQDKPAYLVTAHLSGGTLILPPRTRFTRHDAKAIAVWLQELKDNNSNTILQPKKMFGMTARQLEMVEQGADVPVAVSTSGKSRLEIVDRLVGNLPHPLVFAGAAKQRLSQEGVVQNELRGLSTGTALAAILHPVGFVLVPEAKGGQVNWTIRESSPQSAGWPLGWESPRTPGKTLPGLFKASQTQAVALPLKSALDQLAAKIAVPLVFDHNRITADRIDLEATVKMRAGRMSLKTIFTGLLRQVGLKFELRVDENDKPFLWIAPRRR